FSSLIKNALRQEAFEPGRTSFSISIASLSHESGLNSNNTKYVKDTVNSLISTVVNWDYLAADRSTVWKASGLLAGLGAVMSAARLYAANGLQLGQSYELDAIAAVILGGTSFVGGVGSIVGTLIGALIIAVLTNGLVLLGVSDIWQYIIKGLVIIGAVALDRYRQRDSART
ncbi:hypothetical protein M3553_21840, partial [Bacillus subtilis]|nr:hypothetical protein [Bacillus subtilis]